jgi:menaquinone-dependent protoporphyrinogen oxidase
VVIGGAIQYDNWMSEARDFVKKNEEALARMPVAYFFTCMVLSKPLDKADSKADGYAKKLEAVSQRVTPVAVGRFAGVLDYSRMNLRTRIASKILYTMLRVEAGDYRDWEAINSWVNELHPEMTR